MTQNCPTCNGTGRVPLGYYDGVTNHHLSTFSTSPAMERCRTCNGYGLVWYDTEPPPQERRQ